MSNDDEREITACLHRYCRGIDRMDADLVRSAYHDDGYDDHGDYFRGGVEDYLAWVMPVLANRFTSTMHTLSNITVEVEGDTARSESYLIAYHISAGTGALRVFGARYLDRFARRDGVGWRIAHRTLVSEWQVEQVGIVPTPPGTDLARRDRSDPSY
jgi:ketosteroid isomerase-like protein